MAGPQLLAVADEAEYPFLLLSCSPISDVSVQFCDSSMIA